MVDQRRMARALGTIAQTLITEYGIADVLYPLVEEICDILAVSGAGVLLTQTDGALALAAASDDATATIDALQQELGEGPCIEAYERGEAVLVPDLAGDGRFARFSITAMERGMRAVHALPMSVQGRCIGALSLYRDEPADLDGEQQEGARVLAAAATAYVLNCRALDEAVTLASQLQHALDSRVIIEQAKGKLSAQLGVEPALAFEILRRHCRSRGTKLAEAARAVVDGTLSLVVDERAR